MLKRYQRAAERRPQACRQQLTHNARLSRPGRERSRRPRKRVSGQARKLLSAIRRRTAERTLQAWTTAPHILQTVEADFLKVGQARHAAGDWKAREGYLMFSRLTPSFTSVMSPGSPRALTLASPAARACVASFRSHLPAN